MTINVWIAVDWGTSHLRAWVMEGANPIKFLTSKSGMGSLSPDEFEGALLELVGEHLPETGATLVVCCGMVGAAQGWQDAGYRDVPARPLDARAAAASVISADPRLDVRILPGLAQRGPSDVMRGEETQIAGLVRGNDGFDGVVCLPGTHSKWAWVRDGKVYKFRTFMTGEMFALLSKHSVLRHSVSEAWDEGGFEEGVALALGEPNRLLGDLFAIRADALVGGVQSARLTARLSGLLLGTEIAGTLAELGGKPVQLIGERPLCKLYARALATQNVETVVHDAQKLTLAGLTEAWHYLKEAKEDA